MPDQDLRSNFLSERELSEVATPVNQNNLYSLRPYCNDKGEGLMNCYVCSQSTAQSNGTSKPDAASRLENMLPNVSFFPGFSSAAPSSPHPRCICSSHAYLRDRNCSRHHLSPVHGFVSSLAQSCAPAKASCHADAIHCACSSLNDAVPRGTFAGDQGLRFSTVAEALGPRQVAACVTSLDEELLQVGI
eukprot:6188865-Pleurochrysis_carterae.AAC.1